MVTQTKEIVNSKTLMNLRKEYCLLGNSKLTLNFVNKQGHFVILFGMAIPVVEFSREGYKI